MSLHTSLEPSELGVIVKSRLLDSPAVMLDMTCDVVSPLNQLPSIVAVTLDCDCDCWLVTLDVRVPEEPLVMLDVVREQVYWADEHALEQAE